MNRRSFVVFLLFLAVTAGAASFGATFTPGAWYDALQKPSWNPPNWVFGPVWSVLYLAMAVAAWLVWRERTASADVRAFWLIVPYLAWVSFAAYLNYTLWQLN